MSSAAVRPSYASVLREPHARAVFAAALLGRFSYGVLSVPLTVALTRSVGSYALAGTAIALFGLSIALVAPVRAGLIDRYGRRPVLLPLAAAYAALLGCLTAATWRPGAPHWLLLSLTLAAGVCAPPLGPVMRAVWGEMFAEHAQLRRRAFSLDAVAEEILYVGGPLVAGPSIAFGQAAAGIAMSAVLVLCGTVGMVLSPAMGMRSEKRQAARSPRRAGGPAGFGRAAGRMRDPVLAAAAAGCTLGALNLLVVAFAEQQHRIAAVSWLEASTGIGSMAGGIAYGAREWRLSPRVRLPLLALGLGAALAIAGLSPNLYVLTPAVALVGLCVAPGLATAYLIADENAPPDGRILAGTWVNSAYNGACSGGTALVGLLLGGLPLRVCFVLAAIPALASGLVILTTGLGAVGADGVRGHAAPSRTGD